MLFLIVGASLLGGVLSVLLAATVLALRPQLLEPMLPRLVSFSTGTLLGAALLGMIPHAAGTLPASTVAFIILLGILGFYVFEKLLVWRHCHKHECDVHASSGPLLLIGDSFHNFVDGIVIAGAFLASVPLGVTVALSTTTHEVPQEVGEFVGYLKAGYSRKRALQLNIVSSLASVLGAVLGYYFIGEVQALGPYVLTLAAAGFLYVALADLVPAQRAKTSLGMALVDMGLMVLGIGVVAVFSHAH